MPRRNRPHRSATAERPAGAGYSLNQRIERWRGYDYQVRSVSGSSGGTPYRCPGCDQLLAPGTPHVVAWPAHDPDAEDRRHWHSSCWNARDHRRPGVQRSRNAPRYGR